MSSSKKIYNNLEITKLEYESFDSAISFPKTKSLENDVPIIIIKYSNLINWDYIKTEIINNSELLILKLRDDIIKLINILSKTSDYYLIDKMDSIKLYKNGINVVSINSKNSNFMNYSAYIDISEYKRILSRNQNLNNKNLFKLILKITNFIASVSILGILTHFLLHIKNN